MVLAVLTAALVRVEAAPEPIRVSQNGRYFVDAKGKPFYFLADTQWELLWNQLRSIYPMTLADYTKSPTKPATMLEGVYEDGEGYGYPITPLLARREAYYTCLAGGFHG